MQYNKTVAEVVLRWHLQMGGSMIAKSSHPDRIRENFKVLFKYHFSFTSNFNIKFFITHKKMCMTFLVSF
jgi:diketogulonate reductase-like aldo/keto reductase